MNDGCCSRKYPRAIALAEKFERSTRMIEKTVWQDEKGFTFDVPGNLQNDRVYGKGKKYDVPDENLFASTLHTELKTKIKDEWKDCATDLKPLRKAIKQFVPRLRAVEEKQGYCIKMIFG